MILQSFAVELRVFHRNAQKRSVYQSMQNLYHFVKYTLLTSRNWIHVMSYVTLHVNVIPLTVEDRLLIKALQTVKGSVVEKMT